jgi:hypothetical protein
MSGRALVPTKYMENSQTTQYTVPAGTRAIIDGIRVTNNTGAAATFAINIVPSGGSAGASNLLQPTTSVAAGATTLVLAGTWMTNGDFISTIASAASSLVFQVSGREFQ